jgi:dsRNA-specific ribonuclease
MKAKADLVEALVGAVCLDSGNDTAITEQIMLKLEVMRKDELQKRNSDSVGKCLKAEKPRQEPGSCLVERVSKLEKQVAQLLARSNYSAQPGPCKVKQPASNLAAAPSTKPSNRLR